MKVIDSHIHFWDLTNNINTWTSEVKKPYLIKNYVPDTILKKFNDQLCGMVHIEAHDSDIPTIFEVKWLNNIMKDLPTLKYSHIAFVDITLPKVEFSKVIDELKTYKNVVCIRHILSFNSKFDYSPCDSDLSTNSNIYDNLKYLAYVGFIFNCQMYPYQLNNILTAIIDSNVTCVIDHFGLPAWHKQGDQDHQIWQNMIIKLAKLNNIFIKLSGIDIFRAESEFYDVINFCFDNFPNGQLIYGSNYPVSFNDDYNYWYNYLNKMNLSISIKEQIFFKNAANIFFK